MLIVGLLRPMFQGFIMASKLTAQYQMLSTVQNKRVLQRDPQSIDGLYYYISLQTSRRLNNTTVTLADTETSNDNLSPRSLWSWLVTHSGKNLYHHDDYFIYISWYRKVTHIMTFFFYFFAFGVKRRWCPRWWTY